MPSRKKAKGKARKAAKETKAKEEESRAVVGANQRQEESVEAQMERLIINAVSQKLCTHGCPSLSPGEVTFCQDFIDSFTAVFLSLSAEKVDAKKALHAATEATLEVYEEIYASKLDTVISIFLCNGTQALLDGNNGRAQLHSMIACHLESFMAVTWHKTVTMANVTKLADLISADDHTLVSYYRKRISCSCLDQKYEEVKSVKKMGRCYNQNCSHPGGKVERSKMFSCTRCGVASYCSVECQRAAWKEHREKCDKIVQVKAAFNTNQS